MTFARTAFFRRPLVAIALASVATPALAQATPAPSAGQPDYLGIIADLQRQIDELKATVNELKAEKQAAAAPAPVAASAPPVLAQGTLPAPAAPAAAAPPAPAPQVADASPKKGKAWYEKLQLRGYTQLRLNNIVSGDAEAPAGVSRLRTIGDGEVVSVNVV